MNGGYFKIHRRIFDSDIFLNPGLLRLFLYLIGKARYSDKPNKKYKSHDIIIKRGQFLRAYRKLQEDLEYLENNAIKRYSLSAIKNNLDKLEDQDRIKREKTRLGTLFTIVNYNKYQDLQIKKEGAPNGERTESERSENGERTEPEQYSKKAKEGSKKDKEKHIHAEIDKNIKKIHKHWLEKCSDINKARLTKNLQRRIETKLKKWEVGKIIEAIDNYSEIYNSNTYYSHNWTLLKFIKQSNGIPRFITGLDQEYDGDLWKDYKQKQKNKEPEYEAY